MPKTLKAPKPLSSRRQKSAVQLYHAALALMQENRIDEARELAGRMLGIDENFAPAWDLLAFILSRGDSAIDAELAARKALTLNASLYSASVVLGVALMKQRKFQEAAVHLGAAVKKHPNSALHWLRLAGALASLRNLTQAEFCYRKALELEPDNTQAHLELGNILCSMAREADARTELQAAQSSGDAILALRAAQMITPLPDSEEQILAERESFAAEVERLHDILPQVKELPDGAVVTNFYLAYHGLDDRPLQEAWARLLLKVCPSLETSAPPPAVRRSRDRIRIGFISSHLKDRHTISKLTAGLMKQLPAERFEVIAFDLSPSADTGYLPKFAQKVVGCSGHPAKAVAEIAEAELDIAFYPDIGMQQLTNRMAFSRVAPVQITTWGHPVTTGLRSIDYFLSSDLIEPRGAEAHYTERLVRLSTLPAYYYRPVRITRRAPSFPPEWHIYFCPQSLFKFHPRFDEVVGEILRRDPAGRLVMLEREGEYSNKLGDRITRKYPDIADRLVFLDRMPLDDLMGIMEGCHVMLDTNPFGGGNTTYEALALGAPIVTMPGEFMRGRVTLGCYRKMSFEDCVVSSPEAYVEKAVRIANDQAYREWLRTEIKVRSHVLYHDQGAVNEIAAFFEQAVGEVS